MTSTTHRRLDAAPGEADTGRGHGWIVVLVALLAAVPAIVKLVSYPAYPGSDDAFIHLAVAESVLAGTGWGLPGFGEVNLSSSPLFTVLLLPVLAVGDVGLAQLVTLLAAGLGLLATYAVARDLTASPQLGLVALALGAFNVHLWRWSGTVMEAAVAYAFVGAVVLAVVRLQAARHADGKRYVLLGLVIGAAALTRFEAGLLLPLALIQLAVARGLSREHLVRLGLCVVGFVLALVPWVVFSVVTLGSPVPTTFSAKTGPAVILVNTEVTRQLVQVVVSGAWASLLLVAVGVVSLLAKRRLGGSLRTASSTVLLIGWPLALFAFYYLKTPTLQSAARYYLPGMWTLPVLAVVLIGLARAAGPRQRALRGLLSTPALAAVCALTLVAALVLNAVRVAPVLRAFPDGYQRAMQDGAAYLRASCRPGDVALIYVDIGVLAREGIGPCRLADAGGLASPELQGLTAEEAVNTTQARFVVHSIALEPDEFVKTHPNLDGRLEKVLSQPYASHAVAEAGARNHLEVYRVTGG